MQAKDKVGIKQRTEALAFTEAWLRHHGCSNGIRKSHAGDDHRSRRRAQGSHMSKISRRQFVTAGLAATAGVSGLAVAANLAKRYGLVPPDSGGVYGPGETLTYAAQ